VPNMAGFIAEAHRRRVFRTGGLYVVGAWVLLQVAALALQALELPDALLRYFWGAAFIGFPIALVFGWYYDITAAGIRRTPPGSAPDGETLSLRVPDYLIISALAIVAAIVAAGIFDRARFESDSLIYDPASIAVLPLADLSGDEDRAYFSAGMHDALIASLSKISALKVISRRSTSNIDVSMSMMGIGEVLGVRNIIEGSVTRDGTRVRIFVQLVDAAKDVQIWAGTFEREMTGVLGLQNDIANSIAEAIDVRLTEEDKSELAKQPIVDSASYDSYLRAMYRIHDYSDQVRAQGVAILKKAVERDPDNALLHAGLAYGYALLGHSTLPQGMYPASILSAARAFALDDSIAETYVAVGMQKMYYEWDFPAAENALLRALDINPSLTMAQYQYAWLMELYRDSERSLPPGELTIKLDPLDPFFLGWLADQYRAAGRYEDALDMINRTLEISPDDAVALMLMARTYSEMGDFESALEASSRISDDPLFGFMHVSTLALSGDEEAARAFLGNVDRTPQNVVALMVIHAALGDADETFVWLEIARDVKLPWYPWFVTWFPQLEGIRDDPRMYALAEEIHLEHILDEVSARGD
jgi:TolB-like protein